MQLEGLFWFVLLLAPLVFLQRLLHRELQTVILILTRNPPLTAGLFSMLFLPAMMILHGLLASLTGVDVK